MLTGDKIETAKCIAISAGLKSKRQQIFEMKDLTYIQSIADAINDFSRKIQNCMLVIDGTTL
jgi:phospholipid-translocating ATPase